MFVFTRQRDETIAVEKGTEAAMVEFRGKKVPTGTIHCLVQRITSLSSEIRKEKVRSIRQQLAEGKYDVDERLNVVSDIVFDELFKH